MLSITLILGVLLQGITVPSLQCYQCFFVCDDRSTTNLTCPEDIKEFGKTEDPEACITTTFQFSDAKYTTKGCDRSATSGCATVIEDGRTETICACHTDFCNSSNMQRSASVYALTLFSIVMSFVHRWLH